MKKEEIETLIETVRAAVKTEDTLTREDIDGAVIALCEIADALKWFAELAAAFATAQGAEVPPLPWQDDSEGVDSGSLTPVGAGDGNTFEGRAK